MVPKACLPVGGLLAKARVHAAAESFDGAAARARRRALGLTQVDIADALGIDPALVSRAERGVTRPRAADVRARWLELLADLEKELA